MTDARIALVAAGYDVIIGTRDELVTIRVPEGDATFHRILGQA